MDRRERNPEFLESMMVFGERLRSEMWSSFPGIIQSFNPANQTCSVQPAIKAQVTGLDGVAKWVNMPLLVDCPVYFPSGGGLTLTFPISVGDECLVIFANRCIDWWWQYGGIQQQAEFRMHDLSDGMVLPGFDSVPNVIPNVSTSSAQLRNQAGDAFVEVMASGVVTITSGSSVSVVAPSIQLNASTVEVNAASIKLNGELTINSAPYSTHTHSGVISGSNNTGGVT